MRITILLCLLITIYTYNPPKLTIYIESLCPDTGRFMSQSFNKLYESKIRNKLASSVEIIPFGNAHELEPIEGKRQFECQHNEKECFGNRLLLCAQQELAQSQYESFFICYFKKLVEVGRVKINIDESMTECFNGSTGQMGLLKLCEQTEGNELLHKAGLETGEHDYIPYIIVDGKHTKEYQAEAEKDLHSFLCKFNNLEEECSKTLNLRGLNYLNEEKVKKENNITFKEFKDSLRKRGLISN